MRVITQGELRSSERLGRDARDRCCPLQLKGHRGYENGEERWQTLGRIGSTVMLLVAHTSRETGSSGEIIRTISRKVGVR